MRQNDTAAIKVPQPVRQILGRLRAHGYEGFIVGGCVRDALMGREPHDWDICTSALPGQIMEVFAGLPVIATGLQHGTVTVVLDGTGYEITTYRTDGAYTDGRHPDRVSFVTDLREDLSRRDFTINAMAFEPERGLVDLFGGQEDLQGKVIRCVGAPSDRFQEDYLRILRTMRFASTLGFSIAEETLRAMHLHYEGLTHVSAERICAELRRMVTGPAFPAVAARCRDVMGFIIPELIPCFDFDQKNRWHIYDVWTHILKCLEACDSDDDILKLALLFHDIAKPECCSEDGSGHRHFYRHGEVGAQMTNRILRRLKFDNASRERIVELVRFHDSFELPTPKAARRLLARVGEEQARRLLVLRACDMKAQNPALLKEREEQLRLMERLIDEILRRNECFSLRQLTVNGNDLIAAGFTPGKELGRVLGELLEGVMDGRLPNEREALLAQARGARRGPVGGERDD